MRPRKPEAARFALLPLGGEIVAEGNPINAVVRPIARETRVNGATAPDPYVDGPRLARACSCGSDRLRSYGPSVDGGAHDRLPNGFRDAGFRTYSRCQATAGSTECLASGSIDHTICSVSASSGLSASAGRSRAELVLCLPSRPLAVAWCATAARALRGALMTRSAALLAAQRPALRCAQSYGLFVMFAADHQLPDNASGFVGERHRGELALALEKVDQPRRECPLPFGPAG